MHAAYNRFKMTFNIVHCTPPFWGLVVPKWKKGICFQKTGAIMPVILHHK